MRQVLACGRLQTHTFFERSSPEISGPCPHGPPPTFVSSAYVPVESMPTWFQVFAKNRPISYMVHAVRLFTQASEIEALRGHPAGYFVTRSLLWSAIIVALSPPSP